MNCLKCGRETPSSQVFCKDCLQVMNAYPVSPRAHVVIPTRPAVQPEKNQRIKSSTYSGTIRSLKRVIRRLTWAVVLLSLLVCLLGGLLFYIADHPDDVPNIGQNYTPFGTSVRP